MDTIRRKLKWAVVRLFCTPLEQLELIRGELLQEHRALQRIAADQRR